MKQNGETQNAETRSRQEEIWELMAGSRAVLDGHDFQTAARSIFDACKRITGATAGYMALLSDDGMENEVLFLDSGGTTCTVDPALPMPVRGLREKAYDSGTTVYENDFSHSEWTSFLPSGHVELGSVLFAPLMIKGIAVGLLGLANKPGGFTETDARMAAAFGEMAAVALLNSRALEALQHSEERFRAVAQTASDAIINFDSHGNIVFWNEAAAAIFGYTPDEVIGKQLAVIIPARFHAAHVNLVEQAASIGRSNIVGKPLEMTGLGKYGREFPVELSLSTWKIGEEIFFTGIIRDITERKRAEELLRDQNQFIVSAFESLAHPFYVIDADDYTIKMANSAAYLGELSAPLTCYALTHARHTPCRDDGYSCPLDEIKRTGKPVREEHTHYDGQGQRAIHEVHGHPIFDEAGNVTQIIEYTLDVTARKRTEETLEQTTQLLEAILEHTPTLMAYLDRQFNFIRVNRAYAAADGRERAFFPGQNHFDLYPHPENEAIFRRVVATGEPHFAYAKPFEYPEHPEWGVSYWDWSLVPLKDPGGAVTALVFTLSDVTERVEAELALGRERDFTAAVLDTAGALVVVLDPQGRIVRFNRACENLTGYTFDEVESRPFWDLFLIPEEVEPVKAAFQKLTAGQFPGQYENYWVAKDGSRRLIAWSNTDLRDSAGAVEYIIGTGIDITERRQAQQALRKAHDQLEQRVRQRTAELEKANQELRAEIVHRQRVEAQLRQQSAVAESLVQATLALNGSLDLDQVLDRILEQTQRVIPCCAATVMLVSEETVTVSRHRGFDAYPESWDTLQADLPLEAFSALQAINTSQQPILIADTSKEPEWRYAPGFEWVRSYVAAPMRAEKKIIGFLAVFSEQSGLFSPEIMDLLEAFAAHAVAAILNAERYAAEMQARLTAETLSAASLALTQTLDLDTVINTLLDYLRTLVPYDSACVLLPQDETHLVVRVARDYERWVDTPEVTGTIIDSRERPFIHALLTTQQSVLIPDTRQEPEWGQCARWEHALNWLGVPLIADGRVIGICGLDKTEARFFTQQHQQLAEALIGQATLSIQNAWLFEQVRAGRERLQSLSRRLVEVQESERRYIARELHDDAGQALTSLKVGLRLLEREAGHPEAVVAGVSTLMQMADGVLENLHRLAVNLRPATLDHLGLVAALHQYAEAISDQHGLVVQFEAVGAIERLPSEVETALYRAVQEALTNVVRHAQATRVDLLLKRRGDELLVLVEDNGVGFDPTAEVPDGRLGLIGLRERAEMLGGTLTVESAADAGTTLLLEVPYVDADTHRRRSRRATGRPTRPPELRT